MTQSQSVACAIRPQPHLVSDTQCDDVRSWAVFEKVGWLVHPDFLEGVGVLVCPRLKHFPLTFAQSLAFSADAFEPIHLPHWVQFSLFDEIADVIETWVGCVLKEQEYNHIVFLF